MAEQTAAEAHGSLASEMLAGTVGGVAGILSGSPLDVVKTRVQNSKEALRMADVIRSILKEEGAAAFFKGSLAAAASQVPNNAIVFGSWAYGRRTAADMNLASHFGVTNDAEAREAIHVFAAGSFSGTLQSMALGPFEHVKIQQQMFGTSQHARVHLSLTECTKAMVAAGGFPKIFRGTAATLLRDGPVYGAYFQSYEYTKNWFALKSDQTGAGRALLERGQIMTNDVVPVTPWHMLAAGAVAGMLSWLLALPVDVVKSRIQAAPLHAPPSQTRILHVTRQLYREGGVPVFFRGLVPCLVRAAPVNAVTFAVFEATHDLITEQWALR